MFGDELKKILDSHPHLRVKLATMYEVADSTVDRWVSGVAIPHPKLQKEILETGQSLARTPEESRDSTEHRKG